MNVYWLEQRGRDVPPLDDWLGPEEALRLSGLRFEKRRADWRLGRWTAKHAVSACLNLGRGSDSLREIEVRPAASGAPEVWLGGQVAPVTISLSHRGGAALCAVAVSNIALGCDLELSEPRSSAFIADYFTEEEQSLISERPHIVTLLWSAKESALKALRVGLRLDTRSVQVHLNPGAAAFRVTCDGQSFEGLWRATGNLVQTIVADRLFTPIELT